MGRHKGNKSTRVSVSNYQSVSVSRHDIHHDVDFSFPFLDDEGASQSQAFVGVVTFKSVPQGRHKTVASRSLLGPHLYDLERHTGGEASTTQLCTLTFLLLMFYPFTCWEHTWERGLKSIHNNFSKVINLHIIVFKFINNQRCSLFARTHPNACTITHCQRHKAADSV